MAKDKNAGRLAAQLSAVALALGGVAPMMGCSSADDGGSEKAASNQERPANPCAGAPKRPANPCAGQ